jgi:hypothetical protein
LTFEKTMLLREPVKLLPLDGTADMLVVTDDVGAAAAAGAANAVVDVTAIIPASASVDANSGSRSFICLPSLRRMFYQRYRFSI